MKTAAATRGFSAVAAMTACLLTGCGGGAGQGPGVSDLPDIRAEVSDRTLTAKLPLDDVVWQGTDVKLAYMKSVVSRVEHCVVDKGGTSRPLSAIAWVDFPPEENRTYGRWDVATAAELGVEPDPMRGLPVWDTLPWDLTDGALVTQCYEDVRKSGSEIDTKYFASNAADRYRRSAVEATKGSSEGRAILAERHDCLASQDITSDAAGEPTAKYRNAGEKVRKATAVAVAQCNADKRIPHRLFDLQAKHEAAALKDHADELAAAKTEKDAYLAELEAVIAHG